jgi:hypothetical protein
MSQSSELVLTEEQCLYEHGVAALSCLLSGIYVLNSSRHEPNSLLDEQNKLLRFVKGIHGFHVYATEYWTEYLLASAKSRGRLDGTMLEVATQLVEALDRQTFPEGLAPPGLVAAIANKEQRLEALNGYGALRKHVERSLYARSLKRFESELQISGKYTDLRLIIICAEGI